MFKALRDLDFEVRDKMIVESILDIEFQDPTISDKAIFYTGNNTRKNWHFTRKGYHYYTTNPQFDQNGINLVFTRV